MPRGYKDGIRSSQSTFRGDRRMATFITTVKFTQQGVKSIGETTKRRLP